MRLKRAFGFTLVELLVVEIRALRAVGETTKQNDPTLLNAKEIVPNRYNSKSELTKEIRSGENIADFDLKSK